MFAAQLNQLFNACQIGNIDQVKSLLKDGVSPNYCSMSAYKPEKRHGKNFEVPVDAISAFYYKNSDNILLQKMSAAQLKAYLDPHQYNDKQLICYDVMPIHIAAAHGHIEVVKLLLQHGASADLQSNVGILTAKRTGVSYKDPINYRYFMCEEPTGTPLHFATQGGHEELVNFLVEQRKVNIDAVFNIPDNVYSETLCIFTPSSAILSAAELRHRKLVIYFLKHFAYYDDQPPYKVERRKGYKEESAVSYPTENTPLSFIKCMVKYVKQERLQEQTELLRAIKNGIDDMRAQLSFNSKPAVIPPAPAFADVTAETLVPKLDDEDYAKMTSQFNIWGGMKSKFNK